MPTAYRGRVDIRCNRMVCIVDKSRENVGVDCLSCAEVAQAVVDLGGISIGKLKVPEVAKPTRKVGKDITVEEETTQQKEE